MVFSLEFEAGMKYDGVCSGKVGLKVRRSFVHLTMVLDYRFEWMMKIQFVVWATHGQGNFVAVA